MTEVISRNPEVQEEIERNYRWNFLVNALDGAFFWFGISFFSSTIVLPLFVRHFTADPLIIGLIPFLGWGGVFLPQLFMANAVERAPRKKFFPVTLGFFLERLPIILLAPATYFLAPSPGWFFPIFFLRGAVNAVAFISGFSIVFEFTGAENRPTYIGLANIIPGIAGSVAPLIGGWLAGATSYPAMFLLSAIIGAASWGVLRFAVREPRRLKASS